MKALVLAGGYDQIALINELKHRNYYVILADYFENPVAKKYADKHYQISTLDIEKIEECALKEQVNLITTACTDQALLTVAFLSEKLNLPCYINYQTARNVTNKEYMKELFIKYKIPTAKHYIINTLEDLTSYYSELHYPVVVKPVDCNSSKGVTRAFDKKSLFAAAQQAISFSRSKKAIVESFIFGNEYTVDFWIDHGTPRLLMVSEIIKFKDSFTINGCRTCPNFPDAKLAELETIAAKIATAFHLDNMPMFMQVIDTGNSFYVLEFSARMGGGTKYRMIELYSGFPIMKMYVERITGNIPSVPYTLTKKHLLISYIYCQKGIFQKMHGIDTSIAQGIIDEWYQYKSSGALFDSAMNSGDRVAGILFSGTKKEEVTVKLEKALQQISVLNNASEDMMLRINKSLEV